MMCSVLAMNTASKFPAGHAPLTSSAIGAGVFGRRASSSQARMPGSLSSRSEACHVR
jgi:hypothetical protein